MFKIYQRYLISIFIPPFLLGTIFFSLFLLVFQIFRFIKYLVAKDIGFFEVLQLMSNMALFFLPMAVPLSALLATLYTVTKLSDDQEIVALRSLGVSRERLYTPFFILSILVGLTLLSLNSNLIPSSNYFVRNSIERIASKSVLGQIRPEEFFTDIPGITLFASGVKSGGAQLSNLFIFVENGKEEKIVFAREGVLKNTHDLASFSIELSGGNILRRNQENKNSVDKILFEKYTFPPFEKAPSITMVTRDSMLSNQELRKIIFEKKEKAKTLEDKKSLYRTQLDYYSRFISPLQVVFFVLLGFSLGIKGNSRESKNVAGPVIIIIGVYIFLFFFGISLAKKAILSPFMATFGPTLLLGLGGLFFYRRLNWVV